MSDIRTKPSSKEYREGWAATFRARGKSRLPTLILGSGHRLEIVENDGAPYTGAGLTEPIIFDEMTPRPKKAKRGKR